MENDQNQENAGLFMDFSHQNTNQLVYKQTLRSFKEENVIENLLGLIQTNEKDGKNEENKMEDYFDLNKSNSENLEDEEFKDVGEGCNIKIPKEFQSKLLPQSQSTIKDVEDLIVNEIAKSIIIIY